MKKIFGNFLNFNPNYFDVLNLNKYISISIIFHTYWINLIQLVGIIYIAEFVIWY